MNSAENPPMVDCSVIDTDILRALLVLVGRSRRRVQQALHRKVAATNIRGYGPRLDQDDRSDQQKSRRYRRLSFVVSIRLICA
jgi:hypothetical protein